MTATYGFIPWIRQGIAARIAETDTLAASDGAATERAGMEAKLTLQYTGQDNQPKQQQVAKNILIMGPGDVQGISAQAIVRTEPRKGITNFEANNLAYIEFYEEDFLWRYTPAAASTPGPQNTVNTRLRPWLALVVLKEDEYQLKPSVAGALPYIAVNASSFANAFHDEKDTWAFAHVHINNKLDSLTGNALQDEVNNEVNANPDVAVSRLLCPRKLARNTAYTAFLLPAFETGRLAGLKLPADTVKAQAPSWKKAGMDNQARKRSFDFPVYFQWNFRTANYGDFESLVTLLKPVVTEAEAGNMPMDIRNPGFNLSPAGQGSKTISMDAALKPPAYERAAWPANSDDQATVTNLAKLLNLSADLVDPFSSVKGESNPVFDDATIGSDPLLVPPIYGVWHAQAKRLGMQGNYPWVETLNLDFRFRAAAGLGATVIQQHQEDLMNRAWQQVEKVNEANRRIQEAAMARMVNHAIFKKHLVNAGNDRAVMVTNPVQHLIKFAGHNKTLQQNFIESRIPAAVKSAAFRKITRPGNKTAISSIKASGLQQSFFKGLGNSIGLVDMSSVVKLFNRDENQAGVLTAARVKTAPTGSLSTSLIGQQVQQAIDKYEADVVANAKEVFIKIIMEEVMTPNASMQKTALLTAITNRPNVSDPVKNKVKELINAIMIFPIARNADGQAIITIQDAKFAEFFNDGITAKSYNDIILKNQAPLNVNAIRALSTINEVKALQEAFQKFTVNVAKLPEAGAQPVFNEVDTIASGIFDRLNPVTVMAKRLASTIKVWNNNTYVPLQQLKPVMAYPEFQEAVYTYLLSLSKNYILPNIAKLPNNCLTLLETNQSFIEAFMAGMNHEMARELLWREYPTDQRGSYFRQFWSISDNLLPDAEPEKQLDIKRMPEWKTALGTHNPRQQSSTLVLVVRGELLKKYPSTMVYAQQAEYDQTDASLPRKLKGGINSTQTKFPLFKADIDPDITLFGFDFTEEQARGDRIETPHGSTQGKNAGWFFVFKERPGQVKFGLDDYTDELGNTDEMPAGSPGTWNDLCWEHLVDTREQLQTYHINFKETVTIQQPAGQPQWKSNSADLAAILYQSPVLFARHAAEMLPEPV